MMIREQSKDHIANVEKNLYLNFHSLVLIPFSSALSTNQPPQQFHFQSSSETTKTLLLCYSCTLFWKKSVWLDYQQRREHNECNTMTWKSVGGPFSLENIIKLCFSYMPGNNALYSIFPTQNKLKSYTWRWALGPEENATFWKYLENLSD